MGEGDGAGARFGHADGLGRFAFRGGRRSPARHRDHGDGSAGAPRSRGQKAGEQIKRSWSLAAPSCRPCRKGWGYQRGRRVLPLGWHGMGSGAGGCPPRRGDFGSCRHTCAGRRPFPGLSITQPAWVPTRTQRVPPATPITGLGSAAKGDRYPAPRSPLPVMCGGEEMRCCQNGPRGCRGDTGAAQHPQHARGSHRGPKNGTSTCRARRAAASPSGHVPAAPICGEAPTLNPLARRFGDSGVIGRRAPTRLAGPRAEMPAGR